MLKLFCLAIIFSRSFSLCFFSSDILQYLFFPYSLFFIFFLLQISSCIYLFRASLISLYHFHKNILLYLVSCLCFFDIKLNQHSHSFLCIIKRKYKTPFLSIKLEPFIMLIASSLLIYQKLIL